MRTPKVARRIVALMIMGVPPSYAQQGTSRVVSTHVAEEAEASALPGRVEVAENVGQRSCAQRTGVALVYGPRTELQCSDGLHYQRAITEGQARPLLDDCVGAEVRVPGKACEAIQVGHRERTAQPVCVHAYVGDADESAGLPSTSELGNRDAAAVRCILA